MKNDDNNLHDPLGQTSKNSIFSEINEEVYIIRLWGGMSWMKFRIYNDVHKNRYLFLKLLSDYTGDADIIFK